MLTRSEVMTFLNYNKSINNFFTIPKLILFKTLSKK